MNRSLVRAFGKTLRKVREDRGLSQEQLAFGADLDRTFISMLERGVRQPTLTTLAQLSHVLGVATWELVRSAERGLDERGAPLLRAAEHGRPPKRG